MVPPVAHLRSQWPPDRERRDGSGRDRTSRRAPTLLRLHGSNQQKRNSRRRLPITADSNSQASNSSRRGRGRRNAQKRGTRWAWELGRQCSTRSQGFCHLLSTPRLLRASAPLPLLHSRCASKSGQMRTMTSTEYRVSSSLSGGIGRNAQESSHLLRQLLPLTPLCLLLFLPLRHTVHRASARLLLAMGSCFGNEKRKTALKVRLRLQHSDR